MRAAAEIGEPALGVQRDVADRLVRRTGQIESPRRPGGQQCPRPVGVDGRRGDRVELAHHQQRGNAHPAEQAVADLPVAAAVPQPVYSDELGQPALTSLAQLPELPPNRLQARDDALDDDDDIDAVDQVDDELFPIFREEGEELLPQLQSRMRDWARRPAELAAAAACMRTLHTFKGGARLAGAMRLGEMAHRLETAIEHLLSKGHASSADVEGLLTRVDAINSGFELLGRPVGEDVAVVPHAAQPIERAAEPPLAQAVAEAAPVPVPVPVPGPAAVPAATVPPGAAPIDWSRFKGGAAVPVPAVEKEKTIHPKNGTGQSSLYSRERARAQAKPVPVNGITVGSGNSGAGTGAGTFPARESKCLAGAHSLVGA